MFTQEWDHSQRKVVRYDHGVGDKIEPKGGHGTKVAGAAAGSLHGDEDNKANGVADGAKLHIFDIQQGTGKSTLIFIVYDMLIFVLLLLNYEH